MGLYDNLPVRLATGSVGSGNTTATINVGDAAGNSSRRNNIWIDFISMEAAGLVVFTDGTSNISNRFPIAAKGNIYVGMPFEMAGDKQASMSVVLDAAAGGSGVKVDVTYRQNILER